MLGAGLNLCTGLEHLDLSYNALGDEGLKEISPSFGYSMSLRTVILRGNKLTYRTAIYLSEALEENKSIENLDLSWNEMYHELGIKKFLSALRLGNSTLLNLNMSWNNIFGEKTADYFRLFLAKHKGIQVLDLSNNRFEGVATMTKLALGISLSKTLLEINLGFNPIREPDSFALLSEINPGCSLRFLNLDYVWVNKEFNELRKQRGLKVKVGGVYESKEIRVPDMQKQLLRRARYLGQKPKKAKNRKDFGWFLLRLRKSDELKPVKKSKFEELLLQDKIKFEEGLIDELAKKFRNEKKRIDLPQMLDVYMELFPETALPEKKKKKKKTEIITEQKRSRVEDDRFEESAREEEEKKEQLEARTLDSRATLTSSPGRQISFVKMASKVQSEKATGKQVSEQNLESEDESDATNYLRQSIGSNPMTRIQRGI